MGSPKSCAFLNICARCALNLPAREASSSNGRSSLHARSTSSRTSFCSSETSKFIRERSSKPVSTIVFKDQHSPPKSLCAIFVKSYITGFLAICSRPIIADTGRGRRHPLLRGSNRWRKNNYSRRNQKNIRGQRRRPCHVPSQTRK